MIVPSEAQLILDPASLIDFYSDDCPAHIYALVDLEEPFWSLSSWYRRGDAVVGMVSMPDDAAMAVYAVSTKDPEGCLHLLIDLVPELPAGLLVTGPVGLGAALRPHRKLAWDGPHVRYHLRRPNDLPETDERVVPLDHTDLSALQELYASDPGAAFFLPHMLGDSGFVGVFEGNSLVAAAGTHVLSTVQRCAAIGAVFTRPSHRGQGLGAAVTSGAVRRVLGRVDTLGLNVAAGNNAARAIYEAIGFAAVLTYDEAELA